MGRHVVRTLTGVNKRQIFGAKVVCGGFHIDTDVRIGILIQGQPSRSMLNEDIHQTDLDVRQFR